MNEKEVQPEKTAQKTVKKPSKFRRVVNFFGKLLLCFIAVLAFYTLYLDSKVIEKFEGKRWQIPLQLYAKVESFSVGDTINLDHLKQNLLLNNYQRVTKVKKPGQFALSTKRIIIYQRPFDFGDGLSSSAVITIDVALGVVKSVLQNNIGIDEAYIEPMLIDRIVPDNNEDRVVVGLQHVPEQLLDTLLLVEDRDFYFHKGISPIGILRALYQNVKAGRTVQGGSTLTQQLVKNMFLTREKSLKRKVNEAIMALLLEYRYSKDQLLEAYINEVYLGQHYANGIYGFGLAAKFYFDKDISELSVAQMATLVGVIKGPSYYDPWRYKERVQKRRDLILKLMFEHELLSKNDYLTAVRKPLNIKKSRKLQTKKLKYPAYSQLVRKELKGILADNEQTQELRVFTNFLPYRQNLLEETVNKKIPELEKKSGKDLQVAMVSADIKTGEINALLGDKRAGFAGFNRAIKAKRPIGSLIKPFIYVLALERYQEFQLASLLEDKPLSIKVEEETWQPKNYDGKYRQHASLLDSLVLSLNVPTVNLGMALGLEPLAESLHRAGYQQDINLRPSMLLGSMNMSPLQVTQLFIPIARSGEYSQLVSINKVVGGQGQTLWQHDAESVSLYSSQASYLLNYALEEVTSRGTAKSLTWRLSKAKVAGKTGTTNDARDSWFVGFDENTLVTTWIGSDKNLPTKLTGSSGALVLYADYMASLGIINKRLIAPSGISNVSFDPVTGKALAQECQEDIILPAVVDGLPLQYQCRKVTKKDEKKKSWFEKIFG